MGVRSMSCRNCNNPLEHKFVDLGFSPPSNSYLKKDELNGPETYYPLRTYICDKCLLVQTEDYTTAEEIFNDVYAYFSSTSQSWLKHASDYVDMIVPRLELNKKSLVVEIASNDGYLLKNFVEKDIPCLGVEPTLNTAEKARALGIPVEQIFFGEETAKKIAGNAKADLIIGNNVYAHVPDLISFTRGLEILLKEEGTVTLEFPHLHNLIKYGQFDTIYHEHYSYYTLKSAMNVFENQGLRIYDVEEVPTHGGSLRIYGCKAAAKVATNDINLDKVLGDENAAGLNELDVYLDFQNQVYKIKDKLLQFLIKAKMEGKKVAGYGAAAKGNTLLNYAGVKPDLLPYICDFAESKQGKYTPGGHIPICNPDQLYQDKPDYILILAWNILDEVIKQNSIARDWGAKFVVAIPEIKIIS